MDRSITICGFPESGKTTYLAALWHLVTSRVDQTALTFESLRGGDATHLNTLAARWRDGKTQLRTDVRTQQFVSMRLTNASEASLRLTFPDVSGESYRVMFEERECTLSVAKMLSRGEGILFFIHADRIRTPQSVVEVVSQSNALGSALSSDQVVPWSPSLSPTQIQIVDLLQLLCRPPLALPCRRIAILLSAWDKVAIEGRTPDEFLTERLPLLDQYLRAGADSWTWRIYGVSAQGGDYEKDNVQLTGGQLSKLGGLKALNEPSHRIQVVSEGAESSDLTEPVAWLMT